MRYLSLALLFVTATATAASFGPEIALTPASPGGAAQGLPALSLPQNGIVALWNGDATYAGRAGEKQSMAAANALALDPVLHRDGAVASIGDESLAGWIENDWLYVRRIGSDGNPIGTDNVLLQQVDSRHTMRMALGASNTEYLVVWPEWSRILSTAIDAQGNALTWQNQVTPGDPLGRSVDKVAVASNGSEFLVVWDTTGDTPWQTPCSLGCPSTDREIHAVIVGADGVARSDGETILATSAGMPDVVWNGTNYLVVWSTLPDGGIAGRQVAPGLASMGPVQTFTTGSDWGPAIATAGSSDLLLFARAGQTPQDPAALEAVKIFADGTTSSLSPVPLVLGAVPRQYAIAANGTRAAVAYPSAGRLAIRYFDPSNGPTRVRTVRH